MMLLIRSPKGGRCASIAFLLFASFIVAEQVSGQVGSNQQHGATTLTEFPRRLPSDHLPNPVQLHPKVISGGLPEGDDAFRELTRLGIRTIISVDGARPDVDTAGKFGLRYVHLPHGYDGIPGARSLELAKAVRDLPGPIYIHCHHGKHRSPAAATVACVVAGLIPPESAAEILKTAGTNPNYRGLFHSAEGARPVNPGILNELNAEFPATSSIPPMADAMVGLEHTFGRVQKTADADWNQPSDHPDLDPAHEALLLREHFTELLRTPDAQKQPADFRQMLTDSEKDARLLEQLLLKKPKHPGDLSIQTSAAAAFQRITTNCKACHVRFRDVPLDEKHVP